MSKPLLYVKSGCSWCDEAEEYLQQHGIAYDVANVSADSAAFAEMRRVSGQTKAPTMTWNDEVLADFGVEELEVFLREHKIAK